VYRTGVLADALYFQIFGVENDFTEFVGTDDEGGFGGDADAFFGYIECGGDVFDSTSGSGNSAGWYR